MRFLRQKPRVLLLEDDPSMQRLVTTLLKREGYRVDVVGKGNQAIQAIGGAGYDAILLDLMMPHEGGMTVIRYLREEKPALLGRVILLTATPESVLRSYEKEIFATVRKPFEHAELTSTVARLLGKAS